MTEPIGDLAGGDQERGEHDRVGVEDPRQRRRRGARERRGDVGERDDTGSWCRGTSPGSRAMPPPASRARADRTCWRAWARGSPSWSSGHHDRASSMMQLIHPPGMGICSTSQSIGARSTTKPEARPPPTPGSRRGRWRRRSPGGRRRATPAPSCRGPTSRRRTSCSGRATARAVRASCRARRPRR